MKKGTYMPKEKVKDYQDNIKNDVVIKATRNKDNGIDVFLNDKIGFENVALAAERIMAQIIGSAFLGGIPEEVLREGINDLVEHAMADGKQMLDDINDDIFTGADVDEEIKKQVEKFNLNNLN